MRLLLRTPLKRAWSVLAKVFNIPITSSRFAGDVADARTCGKTRGLSKGRHLTADPIGQPPSPPGNHAFIETDIPTMRQPNPTVEKVTSAFLKDQVISRDMADWEVKTGV